jgi:murein hydrolase activator
MKKFLVFIFSFLIITGYLFSQNKDVLESKRKNILDEINNANELLKSTELKRNESTMKVQLLNRKMLLRKKYINELGNEITRIDTLISQKNDAIQCLTEDLNKQQSEYGKLIAGYYKARKSQNWIIILLSSANIQQAYLRFYYLKRISIHRKSVLKNIREIISKIEEEKINCSQFKDQKSGLITDTKKEFITLENEKNESDIAIKELKRKENKLKQSIKKNQEIAHRLQNEISDIIREELRKAKAAKSTPLYENLNANDKKLSKNFKDNKGKLPWPVDYGVVVAEYGEHAHPALKNIKVKNNGIDINSRDKEPVKCIYDGVVSKVFAILGANNAVIIRHGNFLTLYQNIVDVRVAVGQKVSIKQVIGLVSEDQGRSVLHIEIWEELKSQNPEDWLYQKN